MTNADGVTQQESTYYPFGGEQRQITTTVDNRYKFTGLQRDSESGLDDTLYRKYSSNFGRWLSPDPIAGDIFSPQSLNRYAYVLNNPVNFIDPLGLECTQDPETGTITCEVWGPKPEEQDTRLWGFYQWLGLVQNPFVSMYGHGIFRWWDPVPLPRWRRRRRQNPPSRLRRPDLAAPQVLALELWPESEGNWVPGWPESWELPPPELGYLQIQRPACQPAVSPVGVLRPTRVPGLGVSHARIPKLFSRQVDWSKGASTFSSLMRIQFGSFRDFPQLGVLGQVGGQYSFRWKPP